MPAVLTAVIDSTVLVSAFLTEGGVSAALLRYAREGVFLVFLSEDIVIETQHTLAYPRIRERYDYTDDDVTDFLHRLLPRIGEIIKHVTLFLLWHIQDYVTQSAKEK